MFTLMIQTGPERKSVFEWNSSSPAYINNGLCFVLFLNMQLISLNRDAPFCSMQSCKKEGASTFCTLPAKQSVWDLFLCGCFLITLHFFLKKKITTSHFSNRRSGQISLEGFPPSCKKEGAGRQSEHHITSGQSG